MLLKKPYPIDRSPIRRIVQAALFGLFVFLFLYVFQPFGMVELGERLLFITSGYGMVCFGVMFFLNVFIPRLLPSFFNEEQWNIGREMAWSTLNVMAIGFFNFLFSVYAGIAQFKAEHMLTFELYTILVGVFPVLFIAFIKERRLRHFYHDSTVEVNQMLERPVSENSPIVDQRVTLPSESGKNLECLAKEILYIKSDDNYCEVYVLRDGKVERHVLRQTLKTLETLLTSLDIFYRCHKSYVVNLAQVIHISGNAQGYKLHFSLNTNLVPVSRSKNEEVKAKLTPYH